MKIKIFVLTTLIIGLMGCGGGNKREREMEMEKEMEREHKGSTKNVNGWDRTIMLSEREMQMANVTVGLPEPAGRPSDLSVSGKIVPTPTGSAVIASKFGGRVIKLLVRETAVPIRTGQAVAVLYSPELQALLREYQSAVELQSKDLIKASLRRLGNLGLNENDVKEMIQQNKTLGEFTLKSNASGLVSSVSILEGQYVEAGAPILRVESNNRLWAAIDLYSSDAQYLQAETQITIYHQGTNELIGVGRLTHNIRETGTNQNIRYLVEIRDIKMNASPGTKITAQFSTRRTGSFTLPSEAVVRSGDKSYVFIEKQKLAFERKEITVAQSSSNRVIIATGIEKTDRIAISGGYLLQSTYQLRFGDQP